MRLNITHGDAADNVQACGMLLTDPPFDMHGDRLAEILQKYDTEHIVLITTMRQLLCVMQHMPFHELRFDFVLDGVMPKQSKALHMPNYTHQTGVYITRKGVKSAFNRKRRQRSDVFGAPGYWPTIFHAPRERLAEHGHAKNAAAIADILGCFDVQSVCDPFAGSGSVGIASIEINIDCTLIEIDKKNYESLLNMFNFLGVITK